MKKFIMFCISIFLILQFVSCSTSIYEIQGIDKFHPYDSMVGLTKSLIPNDFLSKYSYARGDYYYLDEEDVDGCYEKAILYMEYSEEVYPQAKQFFLEQMPIDINNSRVYKGYTFFENIALVESQEKSKVYIAYSDEKRILLSIATYSRENYESFESYMEKNFALFDFEEGKINHPT